MSRFVIEVEIPMLDDMMHFIKATDMIREQVTALGGEFISCKAKWFADIASQSEEAALVAEGGFGPNKRPHTFINESHVPETPVTGWRPVKAWDGEKDPYETQPGKYRQGWNADGTIGSMEFLPDEVA